MEIPSYNGDARLISFRWRQEEVTHREKDIVAQRFRCVLRVEMRWLEREKDADDGAVQCFSYRLIIASGRRRSCWVGLVKLWTEDASPEENQLILHYDRSAHIDVERKDNSVVCNAMNLSSESCLVCHPGRRVERNNPTAAR